MQLKDAAKLSTVIGLISKNRGFQMVGPSLSFVLPRQLSAFIIDIN